MAAPSNEKFQVEKNWGIVSCPRNWKVVKNWTHFGNFCFGSENAASDFSLMKVCNHKNKFPLTALFFSWTARKNRWGSHPECSLPFLCTLQDSENMFPFPHSLVFHFLSDTRSLVCSDLVTLLCDCGWLLQDYLQDHIYITQIELYFSDPSVAQDKSAQNNLISFIVSISWLPWGEQPCPLDVESAPWSWTLQRLIELRLHTSPHRWSRDYSCGPGAWSC